MKGLFHNTGRLVALCLMVALLFACDRTDEPQSGGTATIRLKIPQLEVKSRVGVNGDENAINNLRVIILSKNAGSINKVFTSADLGSAYGGTLTINDVPVGEVEMYVIANEGSLNRNYSDLANLQKDVITVPNTTNRKVRIIDTERKLFPKRGSEFPQAGLPMSWMDKSLGILPQSETPQTIKVELLRAVAKLNIEMNNITDHDIHIQQVEFGKFFANSLYLFQETKLDVPGDTDYAEQKYGELSITVPAGGKEMMVCYVYPSFAWTIPEIPCPYKLGFSIDGITYEPKNFTDGGQSLNHIERNTQINIYATLGTPANFTLDFKVVSWEKKTVDVPSFN